METRFDGLETKVDTLETRFDGLETRFDGLETKVDGLSADFQDFRAESRAEHENTRVLFGQAFERLSETLSHEVRIREIEKTVFPRKFAKA